MEPIDITPQLMRAVVTEFNKQYYNQNKDRILKHYRDTYDEEKKKHKHEYYLAKKARLLEEKQKQKR